MHSTIDNLPIVRKLDFTIRYRGATPNDLQDLHQREQIFIPSVVQNHKETSLYQSENSLKWFGKITHLTRAYFFSNLADDLPSRPFGSDKGVEWLTVLQPDEALLPF